MNSPVYDFIDWDAFNEVVDDFDEDGVWPTDIAYHSVAYLLEALADNGWANGEDDGVWLRRKAIEWREHRTKQIKVRKERAEQKRADAKAEAERIAAERDRLPDKPRCEATRKDGQPCRMGRRSGSAYCRHHLTTADVGVLA